MENVQIRLKQARINARLTQQEMADRLGVSQQAYQKIEVGRTSDMRISTLFKLCQILNVSSDWLIGLED